MQPIQQYHGVHYHRNRDKVVFNDNKKYIQNSMILRFKYLQNNMNLVAVKFTKEDLAKRVNDYFYNQEIFIFPTEENLSFCYELYMKNLFVVCVSGTFDQSSVLYGVPKEIIQLIFINTLNCDEFINSLITRTKIISKKNYFNLPYEIAKTLTLYEENIHIFF